jgi:hypothetical protein
MRGDVATIRELALPVELILDHGGLQFQRILYVTSL